MAKYSKDMGFWELSIIYLDTFGELYGVGWDYDPEEWIDDLINCLETGVSQSKNGIVYPWQRVGMSDLPPDAVF